MDRGGDLRRFTLWLSWLLAAGVPLSDALQLIARRADGRFAGVAATLADEVRSQRPLSAALDDHRDLFPRSYRDTIAIAEEAGFLHLAFADLARGT